MNALAKIPQPRERTFIDATNVAPSNFAANLLKVVTEASQNDLVIYHRGASGFAGDHCKRAASTIPSDIASLVQMPTVELKDGSRVWIYALQRRA